MGVTCYPVTVLITPWLRYRGTGAGAGTPVTQVTVNIDAGLQGMAWGLIFVATKSCPTEANQSHHFSLARAKGIEAID